jgi:hypothetical protein
MNTIFFTAKTRVLIFAAVVGFSTTSCATIQAYCFSEGDPNGVGSDQRQLLKQQVRIQDREPLFFGSLADLSPGNLIEEDVRNLVSQEMWQMYQRLGIINQNWNNKWVCRANLSIRLVAYVQKDQNVTLKFPHLAGARLSCEHPISLAFWGEDLDMDNLWDETEDMPDGLHVRSLPFGVRLLSSSCPEIRLTKDLATTFHFIPGHYTGNSKPIVIQTIFWLGMKNYRTQNDSLSAEEFIEILKRLLQRTSNDHNHPLQAVADRITGIFLARLSKDIRDSLEILIGGVSDVEEFLSEMAGSIGSLLGEPRYCHLNLRKPLKKMVCSLRNLINRLYDHMDSNTPSRDRYFLKYLFQKHELTERLCKIRQQMKELLRTEQQESVLNPIQRVWQKILNIYENIPNRDSNSSSSSGSDSDSSSGSRRGSRASADSEDIPGQGSNTNSGSNFDSSSGFYHRSHGQQESGAHWAC